MAVRNKRRSTTISACLGVGTFSLIMTLFWIYSSTSTSILLPVGHRSTHTRSAKDMLVDIYNDLQKVKIHVRSTKARRYLMQAFSKMSNVFKMAGIKEEKITRKMFLSKHICPEVYKGRRYGYPSFEKGFEVINCTYSTPLDELITVALLFKDDDLVNLKSLIDHISRYNSRLKVLIGTYKKSNAKDLIHYNAVDIFTFSKETSQGIIWNYLVGKVNTEYILIADDLTTVNNDIRLERLIREIEILNVKVAGGATRNQNGHWKLGCFQSVYKNFTLVYQEGYAESLHECIFCDFINAPFVTKTDTLKKYTLSDALNGISVFQDFFLKLSLNNHESIVCPDSMFSVHKKPLSKDPAEWITLAKNWQLYRMKFGDEFDIYFSCDTWKGDCRPGKGYMVPPCCLKDLSEIVKYVMKLCKDEGIICELRAGTILNAIKLHKVLPWEVDADIIILNANRTAFVNLKSKIDQLNYSLRHLSKTKIHFERRKMYADIWSEPTMDLLLLNESIKPTLALFNGQWLAVSRNPGLHARNLFGHEIYQHAPYKYGWTEYQTNQFPSCAVANQQNCLDLFNAGGNIPYELPLP